MKKISIISLFKSCLVLTLIHVIFFSINFELSFCESSSEPSTTAIKNSSQLDSGEDKIPEQDIDTVRSNLEPSLKDDLNYELINKNDKLKISNVLTQTSGVSKEILGNDTPAVLTLSENPSIDLEKLAEVSLNSQTQPEENVTKGEPFVQEQVPVEEGNDLLANNSATEFLSEEEGKKNESSSTASEQIPSFSEWAQKHWEEVEKNEQVNNSAKGQNANGKSSGTKLRWKNYASLDCGAKVVAANPESISPGAILSSSADEYKLNACTSRIWFIVELCESIQAKKIELANYELFSSSTKDFIVSVSDRFSTRDWSLIGKFTAKDERGIQSFDLDTQIFGKYIKVEIKSHYGSEHYCPISLFRAFGTSVFEVLQKEDPAHINRAEDDDDEDDDESLSDSTGEDGKKNLFSSATDAVISMVKKAAEVLGNKVSNQTIRDKTNGSSEASTATQVCVTPTYTILCDNCSESLYKEIYDIISCKNVWLSKLVKIPLIRDCLIKSKTCQNLGYHLKETPIILEADKSIVSFFPFKYVAAMCHQVAVQENKAHLNVSHRYSNDTKSLGKNKKLLEKDFVKGELDLKIVDQEIGKNGRVESPILNVSVSIDSETASLENIANASQISPTKALIPDGDFSQTGADSIKTLDNDENLALDKQTENLINPSGSAGSTIDNAEVTSEEVPLEPLENLEEHLETFINEDNGDYTQSISSFPSSTASTSQGQKESVFLRLSNRIKALERNMSLSSQYLEELSKRYKRQVEEMQNLLEKTISSLREESTKRDLRHKELEERLNSLTLAVESLLIERSHWRFSMFGLFFAIIFALGISFFCRRRRSDPGPPSGRKEAVEVLRRKSIDVITRDPSEKKRRPSDQVLNIVRCSTLSNDERKINHRQRKRKKKVALRRSNSFADLSNATDRKSETKEIYSDWVESENRAIEDVPFALEESDNLTLEPIENEVITPVTVDLPVFMKSAVVARQVRSSSQKQKVEVVAVAGKRSISLDESTKRQNVSPIRLITENNLNNSGGKEPLKKEKKGIKRLLKKVF